jgi:hypothetical protein
MLLNALPEIVVSDVAGFERLPAYQARSGISAGPAYVPRVSSAITAVPYANTSVTPSEISFAS